MAALKSYVIFFFQAEDGIRDIGVTGVQTCALPISRRGDVDRADDHRGRGGAARALARRGDGGGRARPVQIGRASCRGRVEISVVAVALKKKEVNVSSQWQREVSSLATDVWILAIAL